jgi:hypothetical protein
MTIEIQVLAWDKEKNVKIHSLMRFNSVFNMSLHILID